MTAPTRNVSIDLFQIVGTALPLARVVFTLNRYDILQAGGVMPAGSTEVVCDENGHGTATLIPNALGTLGTQYAVQVFDAQGALVFPDRGTALMYLPDQDCQLHAILFSVAPLSKSDADNAVTLARDYANKWGGTIATTLPVETVPAPLYSARYHMEQAKAWASLLGAEIPLVAGARSAQSWAQEDLRGADYGGSAKDWAQGTGLIDGITYKSARAYAVDAAADATQTGLDRAQTGLDRVQTGLDSTAASASSNAANGAMLTAVAQASLAASMAASAASVAQQDLSAVQAQALHRAPGPVVATCFLDTSKDSLPNWPAMCDHLSYVAGRTLNGAWINSTLPNFTGIGGGTNAGTQSINAPELVARAMGGTLGANILAGNWASFSGGTITGTATNFTVTPAAAQFAGGQLSLVVEANVSYLVTGRITGANGGRLYVNATASLSSPWANMNVAAGSFAFVVTPTGTSLALMPGSATAAQTVGFAGLQVQKVVAWSPSGSYYPNAVDGKFYRLWRNRWAFSEQFDLWARAGGATVIANADGSADKLVEGTNPAGGYGLGGSASAVAIGVPHEGRVRAKAGERAWLAIQIGAQAAYFNLSTGTPGTVSGGCTSSMIAVPGMPGYYDCSFFNPAPTNANALIFVSNANSTVTYTGDGVSGIYLAQAHLEIGAFTSYELRTTGGQGQDETFDGNTARFPRFGLAVAEASRVVIYDLLSPGRPMWMVFNGGNNDQLTRTNISSITYREGSLWIGHTSLLGLTFADFAKGYGALIGASGTFQSRSINDRNTAIPWVLATATPALSASATVNAVSMCTMPDAPVDPTTGLQVPTIAVFTAGGVSIIQNDGTVRNSSVTSPYLTGAITPYAIWAALNGAIVDFAFSPKTLGASFAMTRMNPGVTPGFALNGSLVSNLSTAGRSMVAYRSGARLSVMRVNEMTPAASLVAHIADTYNTGWWCGDIRRCLLADTAAGVVDGSNRIANGDFSDGTTTGWAVSTNFASTVAVVAGEAQVTATGADFGRQVYAFPTVVGKTYQLTGTIRRISGTGAASLSFVQGMNGLDILGQTGTLNSTVATPVIVPAFVATATTSYIAMGSGAAGTAGSVYGFDNIVVTEVVYDRSYKNKPIGVFGTGIVRTPVAAAAQLVAFSGFSATSYLQEAYSADLDFGTAGFGASIYASLPAVMPTSTVNFPLGAELVPDTSFDDATKWATSGATAISGGVMTMTAVSSGQGASLQVGDRPSFYANEAVFFTLVVDSVSQGGVSVQVNGVTSTSFTAPGTYTGFIIVPASAGAGVTIRANNTTSAVVSSVSIKRVLPAWAFDRSAAAGAYWRLGVTYGGNLIAEVNDGTTTRTVTTTTTYLGQRVKARMQYETSGTLTLKVNGVGVAQSTGTPLGSLTNAAAVLTVGNRRALDGAWPGDLCLLKPSGTVPTDDAAAWMYQQEVQMFQPGAQITLPDADALVDLSYDDALGTWYVASAANESRINGLVRVSTAPVVAGSISKITGAQGCKVVARTTTNPGVDYYEPSKNLKEELLRRTEECRRTDARTFPLDWTATFTATTTNGSTALTGVTGLVLPLGATLKGATVSGTGIPNGTRVLDVNGATVTLSAPATAGASITVSILDYIEPVGVELAGPVSANRLMQSEGSAFDYTRSHDGFRERLSFPAAPTGRVQFNGRRATQ